MIDFFFLIPIALIMGLAGLGAFLWALRSGQYEDLDGAAVRILIEDETPLAGKVANHADSRPLADGEQDGAEQPIAEGLPEQPQSHLDVRHAR